MSQTSINKAFEERKAVTIDSEEIVSEILSDNNVYDQIYPLGRTSAWCTVAGAFLLQMCSIGVVSSLGVFQEFYIDVWLNHFTPSQIGWIAGMVLSFTFSLGIIGGKLYDAGYGRAALVGGSLLFSFSLFMLSLAKQNHYYQVFLTHALGVGLGASLLLTSTTVAVAHHFKARKAVPLGIIGASGSVGTIIYSIMLNQLVHFKHGFPWAVRIAAFLSTGGFLVGNLLIRIPPRPSRTPKLGSQTSDLKEYANWPFVLTILGSGFISQLGLYFPLSYGQLFGLRHGISPQVAFYSIAMSAFSGIIGRLFANYLSNRYGAVNLMILSLTCGGILAIALLGCGNLVGFVVFVILYGFWVDASTSLYLLTVLTITPQQAKLGTTFGIGSIFVGASASIAHPVLGAILGTSFTWWKAVTFCATCIFSGVIIQLIARYIYLRDKAKTTGERTWKL